MQARIVAAARGAIWLAEGWQLFRVAPLSWFALVMAYLLITQALALIPIAGPAAAAVLVPPFTVGLMSAARAASSGARIEIGMLFDAFRSGLRAQLVLGAIYAACLLMVFAAAALALGQDSIGSPLAGEPQGEADRWQLAALIAVLSILYAPVMMMFWFAPPLAAWHSTPAVKALFFSFFAFIMNWRAFVAYGAVATAAVAIVPLLALYLFGAIAGPPSKAAAGGMVMLLVLVLMPTLFGSFYASYRDVFGVPARPA
jgi:hypothetical protein